MKSIFCITCFITLCFSVSSALAASKVVVVPLVKKTKIISREFHYSLPPAAFTPNLFQPPGGPFAFFSSGLYVRYTASQTGPVGLKSPVNLPDGSEIKAFTCYVYDNDAVENFHPSSPVSFRRRMISSADDGEFVVPKFYLGTTGSSTTIQSVEAPSITFPIVDNSKYFYFIYFLLNFTAPSPTKDLRFYGCQITYSLDVITP